MLMLKKYKEDTKAFDKEFNIMLKESIIKFADFIKYKNTVI
jgi:hypothetical protein